MGPEPADQSRRAGLGRVRPADDHPQLRDGDFAILVTGWGERRGVNGIDALSIGGWGVPERGEPSHVALLGAGRVIVEDMRIPEELIGGRVFLAAFPVLLEGCGGAWTRAVAWELDEAG